MSEQRFVVAVDGPSGSGKSTVSRRLAVALNARYLDTGAMYRAVTWAVLRDGIDPTDADAVAKIADNIVLTVGTDPTDPHILVDDTPVDGPIRGSEVTAAVSPVAAVVAVRARLVAQQRQVIAAEPRIVVEGRDIGTVVAPDADLKVYLTASEAERGRRRSAENASDLAVTVADLARRDKFDSSRDTNPLRQADDAVVLDSTELGIDEVVAHLMTLVDGATRR